MKILFVENRYCTRIWSEVGDRLRAHGHDVAHMVQNPVFSPDAAQCFVLPFPGKARPLDSRTSRHPELPEKLHSDRAIRHWKGTTDHYLHYQREITRVLETFRPDVIFGEPTQFHEILTIQAAQQFKITYLFPSATRYPAGRIAFYQNDTMEPLGGDRDSLTLERAIEMRSQIVSRSSVPSYMATTRRTSLGKLKSSLIDQGLISWGWLKGERYVTPSPLAKLALERKQRDIVRQWEQMALDVSAAAWPAQPWVLYAMQMQPESNLDVWGYPWNDQSALISAAALALDKMGAGLVVKPNPRSKYELTPALLEVIAQHRNIRILSHQTKMADHFPATHAVLSVTGTIILECIMAGKPVGVLGQHTLAALPGVTRITKPENITDVLSAALTNTAIKASEADAVSVLQSLYQTSYPGVLYDPLNQANWATSDNLDTIADSFIKVLQVLPGSNQSRA